MTMPWPKGQRTKQCANCGSAFSCGPEPDTGRCWCETREALTPTGRYADCLCAKCLDAEIAAVKKGLIQGTPHPR